MTYEQHVDLRIALATYDTMADTYHMDAKTDRHTAKNWRECSAPICQGRSERLAKAIDALEADWLANVDRYVKETSDARMSDA